MGFNGTKIHGNLGIHANTLLPLASRLETWRVGTLKIGIPYHYRHAS